MQESSKSLSVGSLAVKPVSFVFATGSSWLDRLVTRVTRSPWSHVAMRFDADNLLVETLAGRGFLTGAGDKYAGWTSSSVISRQVQDEIYDEMLTLSRRWQAAAPHYGYATCLAIGIKELFGRRAGYAALAWLPAGSANTLVCSEMLVILWRLAEPDFLQGQDPRLVSPDQLFQTLLQGSVAD
jgi:hypothetical protein